MTMHSAPQACGAFNDAVQCVRWINAVLNRAAKPYAAAILSDDPDNEIVCRIGIYEKRALRGAELVGTPNYIEPAPLEISEARSLCDAFAAHNFDVKEQQLWMRDIASNDPQCREILLLPVCEINNQVFIHGVTMDMLQGDAGRVIEGALRKLRGPRLAA